MLDMTIDLPAPVVCRLAGRDETETTRIVEACLSRVLAGTPGDRIAMMQAALPYMKEKTESLSTSAGEELLKRFIDYCHQKNLRQNVLFCGALLLELGLTNLPADGPEDCTDLEGH